MAICININGDTAAMALHELRTLAAGFTLHQPADVSTPAADTNAPAPAAGVSEPVAEAQPEPKKTRKKAPAAGAVIDQPAQEDPPAQPDLEGLTIEQAREKMKQFAADGHMDQVGEALTAFGVKKVSDVDPDANGKPSAKYAAFVAKIDDLIKAKGA